MVLSGLITKLIITKLETKLLKRRKKPSVHLYLYNISIYLLFHHLLRSSQVKYNFATKFALLSAS